MLKTHKRPGSKSYVPVVRRCALCGESKAILPINEEHRKALVARQVAFVCQDCADRVRIEVEAAGRVTLEPKVSA